MSRINTLDALMRRIKKAGDCWLWPTQSRRGYGRVSVAGRQMPAHAAFYTLAKGPIPEGLEVDHLCRNHGCVNPDHLEPVTHRENVLRGMSPAAKHSKKTHCPKGHPYTPENTSYFDGGRRRCRECTRTRNRNYMRNYRAQQSKD